MKFGIKITYFLFCSSSLNKHKGHEATAGGADAIHIIKQPCVCFYVKEEALLNTLLFI